MTVTAPRRAKAGQPAPGGVGDMAARAAGLEADVAVLARVVARLIIGVSKGRDPASLRAIATRELRCASDAEIDVIERLCGGG